MPKSPTHCNWFQLFSKPWKHSTCSQQYSTHGRTSATCGNLCRLEENASLKEPVGTIEKAGIKRHSCQCLQMMSQSVTEIWPNCHVAFASVTSITSFLCHVTKFHSNHALDRKPMAEESKLNGQSDQCVLEHVFGYTSRITHYSAGKPRREGAKRWSNWDQSTRISRRQTLEPQNNLQGTRTFQSENGAWVFDWKHVW